MTRRSSGLNCMIPQIISEWNWAKPTLADFMQVISVPYNENEFWLRLLPQHHLLKQKKNGKR